MEDLIGYIRELKLHPEHNGDPRRAFPGGDLVRRRVIYFIPYDIGLQDPEMS